MPCPYIAIMADRSPLCHGVTENWEIYVMDADGTNQRRLTDHPAEDWRPAWSPDGTKIAFRAFRDGSWEIYVMDADGTNQRNLTDYPAWDGMPAWSPVLP